MKCSRVKGFTLASRRSSHALLDRDEQSQCDIAANIGVSRASVGVSLRRMEKSGIVKRMINQKDSRYNLVSLTEKGLEMAPPFG